MEQLVKLAGYPYIDRPWLKYYSEEAINAQLPHCTVYENIYQHNEEFLKDTALLYFGKKITYKKLFEEVDQISRVLLLYGIRESDNMVLCTPAIPEAIYLILALNNIGANAVMLNPTFTREQLIDRINETDAKLLFVIDELYGVLDEIINLTSVETVISCSAINSLGVLPKVVKREWKSRAHGSIRWNVFIRDGGKPKFDHELDYKPFRNAIMVYSSGSTGAQKGIQLTNDGLNGTILQYQYAGFHMKRQERFFAQVPIWFSTGISVTMLVPLCLGVTVILEPLYDFKLFYRHIIKYKPNFMVTAVSLLEYLKNNHNTQPAYANFKYLVAGGEYVAPVTEKKINEWLKDNNVNDGLHKGWGMCECGGTITTTIPKCNKIGSAGIPLPQVVVNAFDIVTNQPLQYGRRGELRVQTPCRMRGYYKNETGTKSYFWTDQEGKIWACTGDMGYVDEDGVVYVHGRISDSYINKGGERVYLFDIERAILGIEMVRQCKAVEREMEDVVTHVIHIATSEDLGTIIKIVKETCGDVVLSPYAPVYFKFYGDALPVAPSGKLDIELMKSSTEGLIKVLKEEEI